MMIATTGQVVIDMRPLLEDAMSRLQMRQIPATTAIIRVPLHVLLQEAVTVQSLLLQDVILVLAVVNVLLEGVRVLKLMALKGSFMLRIYQRMKTAIGFHPRPPTIRQEVLGGGTVPGIIPLTAA